MKWKLSRNLPICQPAIKIFLLDSVRYIEALLNVNAAVILNSRDSRYTRDPGQNVGDSPSECLCHNYDILLRLGSMAITRYTYNEPKRDSGEYKWSIETQTFMNFGAVARTSFGWRHHK